MADHVKTYDLGHGAGDGEEYSSIPGYEGREGYRQLVEKVGFEEVFVHPDTGDVYVAVEWLGSECDNGYSYVRRERPLGLLRVV